MTAELVVLNNANPDINVIMRLAHALRNGKLVVIPTETVYGIAANYDNHETMQKLRKLKKREDNSPFTVHLHSFEQLKNYIDKIPDIVQMLADKYWPGPMTLVFPKIGKHGLGFRVVNSKITQQILRLADVTIVATSANLSKQAPALSGLEAMEKIGKYVDIVVESGFAQFQEASSVILVGNQTYKISRDSIIGAENVRNTVKRTVYFLCDANRIRSVMAKAFLLKMMDDEGFQLFAPAIVPSDNPKGSRKKAPLFERVLEVESAGLFAISGEPILESANKVLEEFSALKYVPNHKSKLFEQSMLEDADEIYVMTKPQLKQVQAYDGGFASKVHLLSPDNKKISDPSGKSVEAHRKTARKIISALKHRFFND